MTDFIDLEVGLPIRPQQFRLHHIDTGDYDSNGSSQSGTERFGGNTTVGRLGGAVIEEIEHQHRYRRLDHWCSFQITVVPAEHSSIPRERFSSLDYHTSLPPRSLITLLVVWASSLCP